MHGPLGRLNLRMALDAGSTRTVIDPGRLAAIGIDTQDSSKPLRITTAGGVTQAQVVNLTCLQTLGLEWENIPVVRFRLPSEAKFDGLLGIDLLRDSRLTIDFQAGLIAVER